MAKQPKRGPGRPINPNSLRQAGVSIYIQCFPDERERWNKRAKKESKSLSEVARQLLNAWEQAKRS